VGGERNGEGVTVYGDGFSKHDKWDLGSIEKKPARKIYHPKVYKLFFSA
jgi:hypothetical protein